MRRILNWFFYCVMLLAFAFTIRHIFAEGKILRAAGPVLPASSAAAFPVFLKSFSGNLSHPLPILLLQVMVIVIVVRIAGYLFNQIGQPVVVGEIVAGVILGPSVFGLLSPGGFQFLFPDSSLMNLQFLSQIGLLLFMFVIGMELDLGLIRNQAQEAVIISHASIVIPYALGMTLALSLFSRFAPPGISFVSFSLFMGIAMSITAFPVLARILQERNLTKTRLGALAITCAAADDVTAWCILAALIAIVKAGSSESTLFTLCLVLAYMLFMLLAVRPLLRFLGKYFQRTETVSKPMMAIVFMVLLLSAYATEVIGIHALFGAFMAGVIMPQQFKFRNIVTEKIEDISLVLLLPLFFVYTGLRTHIGLLNQGHLWVTFGAILAVAVGGKFGGSALAAKIVGQSWKDSLSIGALMNTRGLMELVVLNIGYDLGILSAEVFAMMVLMALLTTFLTSPSLYLINRLFREKSAVSDKQFAANG